MARTIDANELMVEIQVCSWDSEQDKERAEDLVLGMPTLTPPNEPLTLDKKRMIAKSCLHYSKSGSCTLRGYAPLDCPRCKEWQSNESNEPLTLEELREMNEVPVWIQNLEEPAKSQWRLLYWDRGKYLVLQGISVRGYLMEEYGESWLAYRRPPEGEEGDVNRG